MDKIDLINYIKHQNKIIFRLIFLLMLLLLILLGGVSNSFVIQKNGGKMPVLSSNYFETEKHFGYRNINEVKWYILSDIIKIKGNSYLERYTHSIGDLFLYVAIVGIIGNCISLVYIELRAKKLRKIKNEI